MPAKKVAIITVNYKAYAQVYLKDAYDSLMNQTYPRESFEIFMTDNDTSKETVSEINKIAPTIKIIESKTNTGWAGGNNIAIKKALKENYDYFVIANIDTVFDKNWLKELVTYADSHEESIIQSKILIYDTKKINSLGNRIQFLGYGYCNGYSKTDPDNEKYVINYASGASMLVKREVFEKIGLFEEEYFMYHDDFEFGWRAKLAGFTIALAPKSIVYHKYSFASTVNLIYYYERNRLITLFTHEKVGSLILTLIPLIPFEIAMTVYYLIRGNGKDRLKTIGYFLKAKNWQKIRIKRAKIQNLRVVKDRAILRDFAGKIVFEEIDNPLLNYVLNPLLEIYWFIAKRLIIW